MVSGRPRRYTALDHSFAADSCFLAAGAMSRNILIIGAFSPEIDLLSRAVHEGSLGEGASRRVYREPVVLEAIECGIGNITAALNFQERILRGSNLPDECIFIGSAGVYPQAVVGDLLPAEFGFSRNFANYEISVLEGRGKIPDLMEARIRTDPGPLGRHIITGLSLPEGQVNSPDSLTLGRDSAAVYRPLDFENMEVFGLASVAQRHNLSFCAIFALTNQVGPDGSRQWAASHGPLGRQLQQDIIKLLDS